MSTQEAKAMETNIMTVSNVRGYIDENGTAWLNTEDIARGLGFTQIAASGNEVVRWERVNKYLSEFGFIPTSGDAVKASNFIPENMFYRLAMKANNKTAQDFQAKVADEILPTLRKTGIYITKPTSVGDILVLSSQAIKDHEQKLNALEVRLKSVENMISSVVVKESLHAVKEKVKNTKLDPIFVLCTRIKRAIGIIMKTSQCTKQMAEDIFYARVAKTAGFVDYYLKACKSKKATKLKKEGKNGLIIETATSFIAIVTERPDLTAAANKVITEIIENENKRSDNLWLHRPN